MTEVTEDQERAFQGALKVVLAAVLDTVKHPDNPDYSLLRAWPMQYAEHEVARAGLVEVLVAEYAEFLSSAFGAAAAAHDLRRKLDVLEAIGLERDVFGADVSADGWLHG